MRDGVARCCTQGCCWAWLPSSHAVHQRNHVPKSKLSPWHLHFTSTARTPLRHGPLFTALGTVATTGTCTPASSLLQCKCLCHTSSPLSVPPAPHSPTTSHAPWSRLSRLSLPASSQSLSPPCWSGPCYGTPQPCWLQSPISIAHLNRQWLSDTCVFAHR